MTKTSSVGRPKILPLSCGHQWILTLPSGATCRIHRSAAAWHGQFAVPSLPGRSTFDSLEMAVEAAVVADRVPLAPVELGADELRALAERAEASAVEAAKILRDLLARRTGRAWSVRNSRGTAWGWIRVTATPKRCGRHGYMGLEDVHLLSSAFGHGVSRQGESLSPSLGVHGAAVYSVAGYPVPEDWSIAPPTWD